MNVTSLQGREGKKIDTKLYAVQSRTAHAFLLRRSVCFIYTLLYGYSLIIAKNFVTVYTAFDY